MKAAMILFSALFAMQVMIVPGCTAAARNTVPVEQHVQNGEVPKIKKDCTICHGPHEKKKGSTLLIKPVEELCVTCHADRMSAKEHKVDIVPPMKVWNLPLLNGKITCITCHDPHKNAYGRMLRMPESDLCLQCHPV